MHLFFQDREDAGRSGVTRPSSADARSRNADTVAINIRHLLGNAGDDQERSFRRALGFPDILPGLQSYGVRRNSDTLGERFAIDERPFDNEQSGYNGEKRKQRFHGITVTSVRDASGRPQLSILFAVDHVGRAC